MRIYISGPIAGTENYLENFNEAEEYLIYFEIANVDKKE